jgi:hypothetical protein
MICDIICEQYSYFSAVVSDAITYSSVIVYKKYLIFYRCLNKERKKRNFDGVCSNFRQQHSNFSYPLYLHFNLVIPLPSSFSLFGQHH